MNKVINPKFGNPITIGGTTHKKLILAGVMPNTLSSDMLDPSLKPKRICKPGTRVQINVGGEAFRRVISSGYSYDAVTNAFVRDSSAANVTSASETGIPSPLPNPTEPSAIAAKLIENATKRAPSALTCALARLSAGGLISLPAVSSSNTTRQPIALMTQPDQGATESIISTVDEPTEIVDSSESISPIQIGPCDADIKFIVHIADIHIPKNLHQDRKDEYMHVLSRLCDQLTGCDPATTLIVIAGDLLHVKLNIEPETLILAREYLYRLSAIAHVIVVVGNHDFMVSNSERTDSITAVADRLNVTVLRDSGIYGYGNVMFYYSSLMDNKLIKASAYEWHGIKIALFHGTLNGASNFSGIVPTHKKYFNADDFIGFDCVMLGHIHKYQTVTRHHNIVYAGSLIQQNFGESIDKHGYVLWDIKTGQHEFLEVPNDIAFVTLHVVDGICTDIDQLNDQAKSFRVRYIIENTPASALEKITANIAAIYRVISTTFIQHNSCIHSTPKTIADDRDNRNVELELISELCRTNLDEVTALYMRYNTATKSASSTYCIPLSMQFKNIFIYGGSKVNSISFVDGITDICSPNMTGKSSIANMILFGLFHKITGSTGEKMRDIVNKFEKDGYINLTFLCNGNTYTIYKAITVRLHKGALESSYSTSFSMRNIDGTVINLNGATEIDTRRNISDIVGSFDMFAKHNLLTARSNQSVLHMSATDRGTHFQEIFGVAKFADMGIKSKADRQIPETRYSIVHTNIIQLTATRDALAVAVEESNEDTSEASEYHKLYTDELRITETALLDIMKKWNNIPSKLESLEEIMTLGIDVETARTSPEKLLMPRTSVLSKSAIEHELTRLNNISITGNEAETRELIKKLETSLLRIGTIPKSTVINYKRKKTELGEIGDKILKMGNVSEVVLSDTIDHILVECAVRKQDGVRLSQLVNGVTHPRNREELVTLRTQMETDGYSKDIPVIDVGAVKTRRAQLLATIKSLGNGESTNGELKDVPTEIKLKPINMTELESIETKLKIHTNSVSGVIGQLTSCNIVDGMYHIPVAIVESVNGLLMSGVVDVSLDRRSELISIVEFNRAAMISNADRLNVLEHNKCVRRYLSTVELTDIDAVLLNHMHSVQYNSVIKELVRLDEFDENLAKIASNTLLLTSLEAQISWYNICAAKKELADVEIELAELQPLVVMVEKESEIKLALSVERTRLDHILNYNVKTSLLMELDTIGHNEKVMYVNNWSNLVNKTLENELISTQKVEMETRITELRDGLKAIETILTHADNVAKTKAIRDGRITDIDAQIKILSDEMNELQKIIQTHTEFERIVSKNMLPMILISRGMQSLVNNVNRMFSLTTRYVFNVEYTDSNKIIFCVSTTEKNTEMELDRLSGFESIMLQISINYGIMHSWVGPRSSLMIIDEAFDCIDQGKFASDLSDIFNVLKLCYQNVLLISHRDIPDGIIDNKITIKHTNGISEIM
jgi:DNA repair exonuclease SbcCD nuclease subunit/DNA repair exonuclease SbcCD ATPase subunit